MSNIEVFGNVLVVDGEYYHCKDEVVAASLSEADGWHVEDHSEEIEAEAEMNTVSSRVSYMDHFAASPQEEAECLSCLTDILEAKTDTERDEVMSFYAKQSYPAEHLPEVFGVMQKVYKTA